MAMIYSATIVSLVLEFIYRLRRTDRARRIVMLWRGMA